MGIELSPLWKEREPHCEYCGVFLTVYSATRDHVHPKSAGGGRGENLVLACAPCNMRKGSSDVLEFCESMWLKQRRVAVKKGMITEAPRIKSKMQEMSRKKQQSWTLSTPRSEKTWSTSELRDAY